MEETNIGNYASVPDETKPTGKLDFGSMIFLITSPIFAVTLTILYIWFEGVSVWDFVIFGLMYTATGISITGGYHRYYSHRTHQVPKFIEFLYLFFGAGALQNSCIVWSSDHRYHHEYTDKEGDPYNIRRGFFWAHMGWMFYKYPKNRPFSNVPDLKRDRLVAWQHKNYIWIMLIAGFGVPTLLGWMVGRPFGGFLWGGLFRAVLTHHCTFLINSAAHKFGKPTFSKDLSPKDNFLLAFFSFGEGYHSFHHQFPGDYRNGVRWYQWDPTKWWIKSLSYVGLAKRLQRTKKEIIERFRNKTITQASSSTS